MIPATETVNMMNKARLIAAVDATATTSTHSRSPARRRPSNASALSGRMSCACSEDSAMMNKRPMRRPSFDSGSDLSLDDASECTHVTSNKQHHDEDKPTNCANSVTKSHGKPLTSIASTVATAKITLTDSLMMKPTQPIPVQKKQTRRTSLPAPSTRVPVPRIDWQSLQDDDHASFVRDTEDAPEDTAISVTTSTTSEAPSTTLTSLKLTKSKIRSFLKDYYEDFDSIFQTTPATNIDTRQTCMEAFVEQYFTPDFTFIRPSGNPLDGKGFATLMAQHISVISMQLVSLDSVQIIAGGLAAIIIFTADQRFRFRGGAPQSDRTIVTAVLNTTHHEGSIQIAHKHRSPGKPIPKTTRWEASA